MNNFYLIYTTYKNSYNLYEFHKVRESHWNHFKSSIILKHKIAIDLSTIQGLTWTQLDQWILLIVDPKPCKIFLPICMTISRFNNYWNNHLLSIRGGIKVENISRLSNLHNKQSYRVENVIEYESSEGRNNECGQIQRTNLNTNVLRARAGIEQRPLVYYHIVLWITSMAYMGKGVNKLYILVAL